ncbi:Golgi resident protein GCP60 [Lingula anatina]|uniref:Golgi resident protein GCP60 n=1 Tax=Lingula anatina TaxID=7574 RepID=A0A1S3IUL9_LINAN|nr:Golgi resident protein GCP60 [Lingula anatina]|eukprot:XP_013401902.1 Golgi resident protein GCP60 [Lingula anatina]
MASTGLESALNDSVKISDTNGDANIDEEYIKTWGFPLEKLYRLCVRFYKEKEGTKAIHLTYQDKLKLVAYTKQASFGKYRTDLSPDPGFLDVVGNDRRQAWQALGDLPKESAMTEFVLLLDSVCPPLRPYIKAHKAEEEEKERKRQEENERLQKEEEEKNRLKQEEEVARQRQEVEKQRQYQQEMQIRAALNQQTAIQFRQYAEQQYPGNKELQDQLIAQLQEQHFQQYMQQVYQQQLLHQQQQQQQLQAMSNNTLKEGQSDATAAPTKVDGVPNAVGNHVGNGTKGDAEDEEDGTKKDNLPPIAAPSMWTRKDVKEFKDSISKDTESVIKVGSGETVTVRVPTHEEGTCLFWEFATDYYDIGFGVYFEWTVPPNSNVSVHVSDSSEDEEEEEETGEPKGDDVEKGKKEENWPPTDEIIPVYRRDSHEEVYCGSHMYPGRGVYLLKFDNSYSLWRSKTLYYRVYYTR